MKWFKHDSDATQDAKVKKLIIRYGAIGYAIYFHCLELIAGDVSESNITFQLEHDSEIIADNLRIKGTHEQSGIQIVEEIVRFIVELKLFEQSGDKIFCFKLLKRMDSSMASDGFRKVIVKAKESHDRVMIESCPSHDVIMLEENRLEEKRIDNNIKEEIQSPKRFIKPTLEEVLCYCKERQNTIDPQRFIDYYESIGWMVGKHSMKDWKAAVHTWEKNSSSKPTTPPPKKKEIIRLAEKAVCPLCESMLDEGRSFCYCGVKVANFPPEFFTKYKTYKEVHDA